MELNLPVQRQEQADKDSQTPQLPWMVKSIFRPHWAAGSSSLELTKHGELSICFTGLSAFSPQWRSTSGKVGIMLCHQLLLEQWLISDWFTSHLQSTCCSLWYCERQEEGALGTSLSLMLYRCLSTQPLKYTIHLVSDLQILSKSLLSYCRLGAQVQVVQVISMQKAG